MCSGDGRRKKNLKDFFEFFSHEGLVLRFFVFCYCLVSFVPMLILHSIVFA